MTRLRSAPASWGDWPPTQERIAAAVARAEPKVRAVIDRLFGPDAEVRVIVATPAELDKSYAPGTAYSPASESAVAGEIRVVGKATKWLIHWNPATDHGIARRMSDYRV
jgi:hypothetical protein